jgi:hypothetical protein
MHKLWVLLLAVFSILLHVPPAEAQERGQVGLTLGYPGSVGLLWHASDAFALRPELFGTLRSSDSTTASATGEMLPSSSSEGWEIGTGMSGLFRLGQWEGVRAYLVPRITYSRSRTTTEPAGDAFVAASQTEVRTYNLGTSLGVQYALARRLSLYGELGVAYNHSNSSLAQTLVGRHA